MEAIAKLLNEALAEGVFPGAVLLGAKNGDICYHEAFGLANLNPPTPMQRATVFDLASLTKPLATAVAAMVLFTQGKLDADTRLGEILPLFFGPEKKNITVGQLLNHTAGFPDYRPYYQTLCHEPEKTRKARLLKLLAAQPLVYPPGKGSLYSDLGYLALQAILETVTGKPLNLFVEERVYAPLNCTGLFFAPVKGGTSRLDVTFAATENCPFRGHTLVGEVHDENAWVLNGVAGHSGLFGTALGVWELLHCLLTAFHGKDRENLLSSQAVRAFWTTTPPHGSHVLGFDTPTPPHSSAGEHFTGLTVGHLGFTGTSFWVDVHQQNAVVLLTNRVHPSRENEKIKAFRPKLHTLFCERFFLS